MNLKFKKATREKVYVKAILSGTAGSGKSYSALRLATGIANEIDEVGTGGSKIAYIGTEGSRNSYYADEFQYDLLELNDCSIENYVQAVDCAISGGYKVLIIDSLTHVWNWVNEQVNNERSLNTFQAWGKWKPKHRKLLDKILFSSIHVIATARGKDEYVMEVNDKGKQAPKKVGLGLQQDKDIQYDFTVAFMLDQESHVAHAEKDNTHLFENGSDVLTEKHGKMLLDWANKGKEVEITAPTDEAENLAKVKAEIIALCQELGGTKNAELMNSLKEYVPNSNPNYLKNLTVATECLERLKKIQPLS